MRARKSEGRCKQGGIQGRECHETMEYIRKKKGYTEKNENEKEKERKKGEEQRKA